MFGKAADHHLAPIRPVGREAHDGAQGHGGGFALGVAVGARADAGEGDALQPVFGCQAQGRFVARSQLGSLVAAWGIPDGPHGVDDFLARQAVGVCHLAFSRAAAAQRAAFGEQPRPGGAVDGPIDAAPAQQRAVGGVHDGVDGERGDVGHDDVEPLCVLFHDWVFVFRDDGVPGGLSVAAVARGLLQTAQIYLIVGRGSMAPFEKHDHVYGRIDELAVGVQVVVVENDGLRQVVVAACHDVGKGAVALIVLARFHFDGQHLPVQLDDEIEFATSFVVVIIGRDAVRHEFLGHGVLVDGAEVDVFVPLDDAQLYVLGILAGQQAYVALKELEEVARSCQQQRGARLFDVVDGNGYAGVGEPQKTVPKAFEFGVFVEPFQDEAFVFGVQFGRNEAEYVFDVEFVVGVVLGYVAFIHADDVLLHAHHLLQVVALDISAHCCRHAADNEVKTEQLHHLFVNETVDGRTLCPSFA